MTTSATSLLLTLSWAIPLECACDRRAAIWDILQPVSNPSSQCWFNTKHLLLQLVSGFILHNNSPFDRHHFLVSCPTRIGNCALLFDILSLRLQKAVRIQPLCDISSPAQWNDMCHVVSLQSHPHFTLTNEGGCSLPDKGLET